MKNFHFSKILTVLWMVLSLHPVFSQECSKFNNGSLDAWVSDNAWLNITKQNPNADGTPYLRVTQVELDGAAWLVNQHFNSSLFPACGTMCWDFKLFDDGFAGGSTPVNATITIFDGTIENPNLSATFYINLPMYEQSAWRNICAPIKQIANGAPLPSNGFGSWYMDAGYSNNDWNLLLNSFDGVAFRIDVEGAENAGVIGIDNFCTDICCPNSFDADFTMNAVCNNGAYSVQATAIDPSSPNHNWVLMQTTAPNVTTGGTQVGATLTGTVATFSLNISNFYYIVHQVWQNNCQDLVETRHAVPIPQASNVFNLENAAGTDKTIFCYGEDVYLDGTASSGENAYDISVERLTDGAYYSFFTGNATVGIVNLTETFANLGLYFVPGSEYRVKLALQNTANCIAWTEKTINFKVICCEEPAYISASFTLDPETIPGSTQRDLTATNVQNYTNYGAQHQWYVFSTESLNGGPHTLIGVVSGFNFVFRVDPGVCYFVIHRVTTPCGQFCYLESDCANHASEKGNCDLCGSIDCSFLDDYCIVPTNPQAYCDGNGVPKLVWDAVPGTSSYNVEITFNDPKCCRSENPTQIVTYTANTNALLMSTVPQPVWDCFKWRVTAVCENGGSGWTPYSCFAGCPKSRSNDSDIDTLPEQDGGVLIYPNPANDWVDVLFDTPYNGSIQLIDAVGRVIEQQEATEQVRLRFSLNNLSAGMYWVVTQNENGRQVYKLIKK